MRRGFMKNYLGVNPYHSQYALRKLKMYGAYFNERGIKK